MHPPTALINSNTPTGEDSDRVSVTEYRKADWRWTCHIEVCTCLGTACYFRGEMTCFLFQPLKLRPDLLIQHRIYTVSLRKPTFKTSEGLMRSDGYYLSLVTCHNPCCHASCDCKCMVTSRGRRKHKVLYCLPSDHRSIRGIQSIHSIPSIPSIQSIGTVHTLPVFHTLPVYLLN